MVVDPILKWHVDHPADDHYQQVARKAFSFFRQHASGRYSSRNLVRLANLADAARDNGRATGPDLPILLSVAAPWSYDEDTETKRGGLLGVCAWWPDNGRCMLAVHRDKRRSKIGTAIVSFLGGYMYDFGIPVFWVGRQNTVGQRFLLANGLTPTAINSNGALRYCSQSPEEEDGEDRYGAEVAEPTRPGRARRD